MHQRVGKARRPEFTEIRISVVYSTPATIPLFGILGERGGGREEAREQRTRGRRIEN